MKKLLLLFAEASFLLFLLGCATPTGNIMGVQHPHEPTPPSLALTAAVEQLSHGFYADSQKKLIPWHSNPTDFSFLVKMPASPGEWRIPFPERNISDWTDPGRDYHTQFFFGDDGFRMAVLHTPGPNGNINEILGLYRQRFGDPTPTKNGNGSSDAATNFDYEWSLGQTIFTFEPIMRPSDRFASEIILRWKAKPN